MKELIDAVGSQSGGSHDSKFRAPASTARPPRSSKTCRSSGSFAPASGDGSVAWEKERGTAAMILTKTGFACGFPRRQARGHRPDARFRRGARLRLGYVYTLVLYPTVFPLGGYWPWP